MKDPIILTAKPQEILAIQWTNNEPYIREFIGEDKSIRFPHGRFEVWNNEQGSWINVPMWHYVYKGTRGELGVLSPEQMEKNYNARTLTDANGIEAEVINIPNTEVNEETSEG
jgi:hypothetical protein